MTDTKNILNMVRRTKININEQRNFFVKESHGGEKVFQDFYIVVDLYERGEYAATIYNPNDEEVYSIRDEAMSQLIEDGFLKYVAHEDLGRLALYLADIGVIPKGSYISSEWFFNDKVRSKYDGSEESYDDDEY